MKILPLILLLGFCFAQDSTSVVEKLGEVGEMRIEEQMKALNDLRIGVQNTIIAARSQIEMSEGDLGRITYAEFILGQLLDPPEQNTDLNNAGQ